jgi:hypothetical protein
MEGERRGRETTINTKTARGVIHDSGRRQNIEGVQTIQNATQNENCMDVPPF